MRSDDADGIFKEERGPETPRSIVEVAAEELRRKMYRLRTLRLARDAGKP